MARFRFICTALLQFTTIAAGRNQNKVLSTCAANVLYVLFLTCCIVHGTGFPSLIDVTVEDLQTAMESGLFNSVELTTVSVAYKVYKFQNS